MGWSSEEAYLCGNLDFFLLKAQTSIKKTSNIPPVYLSEKWGLKARIFDGLIYSKVVSICLPFGDDNLLNISLHRAKISMPELINHMQSKSKQQVSFGFEVTSKIF